MFKYFVNYICYAYNYNLPSKEQSSKEINGNKIIVKFKSNYKYEDIKNIIKNNGAKLNKSMKFTGLSILDKTDKNKSIDQLLKIFQKLEIVEYAEPDHFLYINSTYPNDPLRGELWGLHNTGQNGGKRDADIDAPEAWDINSGTSDTVIGIIDTGVDYNHEDLSQNIWLNPGETPSNGIDDDGNGYIDDIHGIDIYNSEGDPYDDNGHGTHVAGTIGAVANNGVGVVGVDWNSRIMALKIFNADGQGAVSGAIEALEYAIAMKSIHGINIKIINASWATATYSQSLHDAIEKAAGCGILFIAAAGNGYWNDNDTNPYYPASYDLENIISVGATNRQDELTGFSNLGVRSVDLAAPGHEILSTTPANTYTFKSGTSMATPHVAGAAALIWSQYPTYAPREVKQLIMNTVDPLPSLSERIVTGGRLNIYKALSCVPGNPKLSILSPLKDFTAYKGYGTTVSVSLSDCSSVLTGATVLATPTNGDSPFALRDDGINPDASPDDGIYSGTWNSLHTASTTLNIEANLDQQFFAGSVSGRVIDIPQYQYDNSIAYNWIDATTGTRLGLLDDNDFLIPIGFDFKFYGNTYNKIRVASNGYLTFETGGSKPLNNPIPSSTYPNNLIAPFWDDLNPSAGGAGYYLLQGTAPNRMLVIEWHDVPHYANVGKATFEVILYERTNDIVFQYKNVAFGTSLYDGGTSATVGIEAQKGLTGLQYSYNQPILSNETAIRYSYPQLKIQLNNNQDSFLIGETIQTKLTVRNETTALVKGDLWIAIRRPGGGWLFYDSLNRFSSNKNPSASCVNLPPGFYVIDHPVINYTFPQGSEGTYTWYAILTPCGAEVTNAGNWLASYVENFTVKTR